MASRQLGDHEVIDFLERNPNVRDVVHLHESLYGFDGSFRWDQVLAAESSDPALFPIPPRGLAVQDDAYGFVVVFPDASGVLHFNATDNTSLVSEIGKPVYTSDPQFFELYADIANRYGEVAQAVARAAQTDLIVLGAVALVVGGLVLRK